MTLINLFPGLKTILEKVDRNNIKMYNLPKMQSIKKTKK